MHAYISFTLKNLGCHAVAIDSVDDHIHILFDLARTVTVSKVVEEIKTSSSIWIKKQGPQFASFSWQSGYGAFAVSYKDIGDVTAYIDNQRQHHHSETFQEEYRRFLRQHGVAFDERYVWD